MATGKRASMREGPLADLFRKTSEDRSHEEEPAPASPSEEPAAPSADRRRAGEPEAREERRDARPSPSSPAARSIQPRLDEAPPEPTDYREPPAEPVTHRPEIPEQPRHRAKPHPSLEPNVITPEPEGPPHHVRSAQERLRHAFANEPEPVREREVPPPPPEPPAPAHDVYARSDREYEAFPPAHAVGQPVLRVVGVGGAGVNAVNRMVEAGVAGVEFLAINTDLQSLQLSAADQTLHIGDSVTRGLGSGSDPDLGRRAAREEYDRIKALLRGSDMVFIAAGAGGGTGTGAAPVVAQIARELGALTVGIVTRPFQFEGSRRRDQAEAGIDALAGEVDTLIVVPNNRLLSVLDRGVSMVEAFRVADDVLRQGVQGVSDLVTLPGLINLDFADVRTIMSDAGNALLGIGMGTGERRAIDAAEQAVASPLLETSMEGARSILLSITGGHDISLWEVNEAAKAVAEAAHPDANIIFGAMVDDKLDDQVWVTVVATGFGEPRRRRPEDEPFASSRPRAAEPEPRRPSREPAEDRPRGREDWRTLLDRHDRGRDDRDRGRDDRDRDDRRELREPAGEPRVSRVRRPSVDLDVPEFIPRR